MASGQTRIVGGIIPKKSAIPGKIPTGTTAGEIFSNLLDRKLWGYDGSNIFEYGVNSFLGLTGGTVSGDTKFIGDLSATTFYSGSTSLQTIIDTITSGSTSQNSFLGWTGGSGLNSIINNNGNAIASGIGAISEGGNTIASGDYSHAEGYNTVASGNNSHAEGSGTQATGNTSHAEGVNTKSFGTGSHSEGSTSTASGNYSHAEGGNTLSSGVSSHAEGLQTTASALASHSEGRTTLASGNYSHAGGYNSTASGDTSFVHGQNSFANGLGTIVLGNNLFGNSDNTVYVNTLNINNLVSGTSIYNLGIDAVGNIIIGSTGVIINDIFVTGGTYLNGVATFTNNTGGTFSVSGFSTGSTNVITQFTGGTVTGATTFTNSISATTYLGLPKDVFVTGGTFSSGTAIFSNNTGGTFSVSGFSTGSTNVITQFTGGTVTGATNFTAGLTTNSISATTYLGLPKDVFVTGGTFYSGTATFANNTGGTFSVSGFSTGSTNVITQFTGGTVTGTTNFIAGLTTNSISATTISGGTIFSGSTNIGNLFGSQTSQTILQSQILTKASLSGATFTGAVVGNSLSATTISGGTFYGNGGSLTGISGSFGITIDGAGSVITTGVKGYAVMPYGATIVGWDIIGNASGNCAIDVWKNTTIPTVANTITGTEKPTISNQQINSDNNLTTWNTNININDVIAFNVISASTVSRINLIIKVIKK